MLRNVVEVVELWLFLWNNDSAIIGKVYDVCLYLLWMYPLNLFKGGSSRCGVILEFWRKWNAVKILPTKNECDGRAVETPYGEASKNILCSFKEEGIFPLKGCQNEQWREHISQVYNSIILCNFWLSRVSNINGIWYGNLIWRNYDIKVRVKHCWVSFIFIRFEYWPNWLIKKRDSGNNDPFLQ